jgi:CHAT domain-containing protein
MLSALLSTPSGVTHSSMLAIGQENTPDQSPLPGTKVELACIKKHAITPLHYAQLDNNDATITAVLAAMDQHDWVHLACHAHQNFEDPTESGFFLHDGTLSLASIMQKSFKAKGLAFLSACQTARGDENLADEVVHLACGMLMARYPSVIATMWSVMDADAPEVADIMYAQLLKNGKMEHRDAAKALHAAVGNLRAKRGENAFVRWVPYIHMGV